MTKEVNRKYKDTVFRMLFSDTGNALSLYNSLNGTAYTDAGMLRYNTLENAIYMNVKNDISFLIAHHMNLYEHQSTLNPNMPLRNLMYISDLLQVYIKDWSIYSTRLQKIPTPAFFVFYNGPDELPERLEVKLSDAFEIMVDDPSLELKVTVLNINPNCNEKLKTACPVLRDYMSYVEKIRNYAAVMELRDAVERAVDECIRENILREFLLKQKMEVIKVSIYEYDEEREMRLIRADERALGREEGIEQGIEQGMEQGMQAFIELCKEFGCTIEETVSKVREKYHFDESKASSYAKKYWNEKENSANPIDNSSSPVAQ